MRILAIRGRNLASLAGDFEMRLDAPPLADAGLFAITGRTGSGKSTTLDALCLALFDRMPRLPQRRGVDVGRAGDAPESRLKDNDVRSVLRRGTGEGYAEVDFRGVDGRRYRARWSVRRARERPDGRFQAQTLELEDLDSGLDLSGTKTEVLDAIQKRLGLTFDQFRRSVLLAQGDFAAFLRADAGERADLLERITGTAVYGEISKASHLRAAEEKKKLELLSQRLGDQRPLDREARIALQTELSAARQALDEQLLVQRALQQAQRWYQTLDKLAAERDQAGEQLSRALSDLQASEPRQRDFERILGLQPLRLPLTAFDRAVETLELSRRDLERSVDEEGARRLGAERAAAAAATDEAALAAARIAVKDAAPFLQTARRLDTQILGAREQAGRAAAERETAQRTLEEVAAEQDGLRTRSDQVRQTLGKAEDWLAAHAGVEPLAAQWERWASELERYARARVAFDKAGAAIEAAEHNGAVLASRRQEQEAQIARSEADRKRLVTERAELESRAASGDLESLAARREQGLARQRDIEKWRRLATKARFRPLRMPIIWRRPS